MAQPCPPCGRPFKPIWKLDYPTAILRVHGRSIQLSIFQAEMVQMRVNPAGRIVFGDEFIRAMYGQRALTRLNSEPESS